MKFSIENFLANPWKYAVIGLALAILAAFAGALDLGQWSFGYLLTQVGFPALAGVVGYMLLKRRRDRGLGE